MKILKKDEEFLIIDGDKITIFSVLDNRSNIVKLRGAVTRAGDFELGDSLKISQLISKADGLLNDAFLDRADIIRLNLDLTEKLVKLDLKKALKGDVEHDLYLKPMDQVKVYSSKEMYLKKNVSISGYVQKPGKYSLIENMTIYDLLFISGNFLDENYKNRAYLKRADLIRFNNDGITKKIISFNLNEILINPASDVNIDLLPNDHIKVYENNVFISPKPVTISGVVRNEGVYDLKINMTLKDLIIEAGGLNKNIYRYRAEIARIDPFNKDLTEYAKVLLLDIDETENNSIEVLKDIGNSFFISAVDVPLKPYDLISIRPDPFFKIQKKILISGEILYPGEYTILKSEEKITDIINRAGGLLSSAYPDASEYFRNGQKINISLNKILEKKSSKLNFNVQSGDELHIKSFSNSILINGEVNKSGAHKFADGKRLRYYLKLAGGLSPKADNDNIWIEYPNGDSKKYNKFSFLSPKVIDGSIIKIGPAKEKVPFDKTEFAKELTSILANLAQAIAVVVLAGRSN